MLSPIQSPPPVISRRLLAALAASLMLHAVAFIGRQVELSPMPELKRLEMKLVRTAPDLAPGDVPPPEAPKPKKRKPKPQEAPPQELPQAQLPEPPTQEAPPKEEAADALDPPKPPEAAPSPTPPDTRQFAGTRWPRGGRIVFSVFMGEQRFHAGTTTHQWQVADDGSYKIEALTEPAAVALIPWFKPGRRLWVSVGRVNERGLQPAQFIDRQDGKPGEVRADMDRVAGEIRLGDVRAPLPENTQDVLSFFYQIGYPGVITGGDMPVATGRRVDSYRFEVVGEEALAMPFGMTWRTTRVRARYGQGSEMTEVWIAPEQFGLPVQIRNVDRKGVVYYMIATDVRVAQDAVDRKNP